MVPSKELLQRAQESRERALGNTVHFRAVIEFSNVCHHNCLYCGMRVKNRTLPRYRLEERVIIQCAEKAVRDGIRIIMLQGGDDLQYNVGSLGRVVHYISTILGAKVILCIGDRPLRDYESLQKAGATQAIVKFETTNKIAYTTLRPHSSLESRLALIRHLSLMGFQVSSGFIQGLPGTTVSDIEQNIQMVLDLPLFAASVSPFIPSEHTPLRDAPLGALNEVIGVMAKLRIARPSFLIPSVSALSLLSSREGSQESGQLMGLLAGANVLTVNYTPRESRDLYVIYRKQRWVVEMEFAKEIVRRAHLIPSPDLDQE